MERSPERAPSRPCFTTAKVPDSPDAVCATGFVSFALSCPNFRLVRLVVQSRYPMETRNNPSLSLTTVIYRLAFAHDKYYHGGKNRSDQLREWILSEHPGAREWEQVATPHPLITLLYGLIYYLFYQPFRPFGFNSLRVLGHDFYAATKLLRRYPDISAVYIEGTGFGGANIATYFKTKKISCYLMPCNIESLVPYSGSWTHGINVEQRFLQDIRAFKAATNVFCISYTDYWLLSLFDVPASLLPYSPVGVVKQRCAEIAARRKVTDQESYLLYLANFENVPNVRAIVSFVEYVKGPSNKIGRERPIMVVGRGLDEEIIARFPSNMTYLGRVSDEQLDDLLVRCEGVILYHYATTGALTRLEEYKLMEVPIYANVHAVKGIPEANSLVRSC